MTDVKTTEYNFTLPDDTADLFEKFCLEQPNSPKDNIASRLIRNGIDAVCLLHPRFQDAMNYSPHPMSEAARLIAAQQERIEALEAAEDGYGAQSLGAEAIAHLREMYPAAFKALGPSGRTSTRNYINSRAALKGGQ